MTFFLLFLMPRISYVCCFNSCKSGLIMVHCPPQMETLTTQSCIRFSDSESLTMTQIYVSMFSTHNFRWSNTWLEQIKNHPFILRFFRASLVCYGPHSWWTFPLEVLALVCTQNGKINLVLQGLLSKPIQTSTKHNLSSVRHENDFAHTTTIT